MYVYLRIGDKLHVILLYVLQSVPGRWVDIYNGFMCEFLEVNLTKAQVTQL